MKIFKQPLLLGILVGSVLSFLWSAFGNTQDADPAPPMPKRKMEVHLSNVEVMPGVQAIIVVTETGDVSMSLLDLRHP